MYFYPCAENFLFSRHFGYDFAVLSEARIHLAQIFVLLLDFLFERKLAADIRAAKLVHPFAAHIVDNAFAQRNASVRALDNQRTFVLRNRNAVRNFFFGNARPEHIAVV